MARWIYMMSLTLFVAKCYAISYENQITLNNTQAFFRAPNKFDFVEKAMVYKTMPSQDVSFCFELLPNTERKQQIKQLFREHYNAYPSENLVISRSTAILSDLPQVNCQQMAMPPCQSAYVLAWVWDTLPTQTSAQQKAKAQLADNFKDKFSITPQEAVAKGALE